MKLKMLTGMSGGPELVAGDIVEPSDEIARAWIEAGIAEAFDEAPVEPKSTDPADQPEPEPRPYAEVVQPSVPSEVEHVEMPSRPAPEPPQVELPSVPAPAPEVIEEAVSPVAPQNAALKRGRKVK